jgi:hypothetical protein
MVAKTRAITNEKKDIRGVPVLKALLANFINETYFKQMEPVIQVIMENTKDENLSDEILILCIQDFMSHVVKTHEEESIPEAKQLILDVWSWLLKGILGLNKINQKKIEEEIIYKEEFEEKIKKIKKQLSFVNRITSYDVPDLTPYK